MVKCSRHDGCNTPTSCAQLAKCGHAAQFPELKTRKEDQPLPVHNDEPLCHDMAAEHLRKALISDEIEQAICADLEARKQLGIRRYRYALQPFNGRSFILDCYEEVLDALAYMTGVLYERHRAGLDSYHLEQSRDGLERTAYELKRLLMKLER